MVVIIQDHMQTLNLFGRVDGHKCMVGVDKSDQLLSYYGFSHRTVKWRR